MKQQLEIEGTWEEVLEYGGRLKGHRVRLALIPDDLLLTPSGASPNALMLAAMRKADELSKNMAFSPADDTLRLIREARAGAMYGHNPYE